MGRADQDRTTLALAAANGAMAVLFGAFGAHAALDPQARDWFRTGSDYQLAHAAAGLACVCLARLGVAAGGAAAWLLGLGGLAFALSLYLTALTGLRVFGAAAPIGGVLMAAGWAVLGWGALRAGRAA